MSIRPFTLAKHLPGKIFLTAGVFLSVCSLARAQSFSIDAFTIDGGGGRSTGSVFNVSGTIGQPDAGTMSGGAFSLAGGFWAMVTTIQTAGAPTLNVELSTNGFVRVWWLAPATGFALEQSAAISPPNSWDAVPQTYQTNGTQISVLIPAVDALKFYRLRRL